MESARLTKTKAEVKLLPPSKRERATKLLLKAEFMESELNKLEEIIKDKGWVEPYQNGANQKGFKKCTEGETYIALSKIYLSCMKALDDILPNTDREATDELMDFVSGK